MIRLENRTFDNLKVGDRQQTVRTLTGEDVERFAEATAALDPADAGNMSEAPTEDDVDY